MEQFRAKLDDVREACQALTGPLPHGFGRGESVPEKEAVITMIEKAEKELDRVKYLLRDM